MKTIQADLFTSVDPPYRGVPEVCSFCGKRADPMRYGYQDPKTPANDVRFCGRETCLPAFKIWNPPSAKTK